MKKQTLLLAALLLLLSASAQKADRSLLTGKWNFYYFSNSSVTLNTDKKAKTVEQTVKAITARSENHTLSEKDSAAVVSKTYYAMRQVDSSYIEFTKNGEVTMLLYLDTDGGRGEMHKGTYKWTGDKQFVVYFGEDVSQFTVSVLTANNFEAVANDDKPAEEKLTVKFKR